MRAVADDRLSNEHLERIGYGAIQLAGPPHRRTDGVASDHLIEDRADGKDAGALIAGLPRLVHFGREAREIERVRRQD